MQTKVAKRAETEENPLTYEALYRALYDKFIARFEANMSFVYVSNIDAHERRAQIWERANSEIRYIRLKLESANLLEECYWHDLYNDMQQYIDGYIETSMSEFMKNFLERL